MKLSEASILLSPGYGWGDDTHWLARWSRQMKTAQLVEHKDYKTPKRDNWVGDLVLAVEKADKPVMLVGHSLGAITIAHALPFFAPDKVVGAFLVAPSDWEREGLIPGFDDHDFKPIPRQKFPFRVQLVASRNDETMEFEKSEALASAWGASLIDAGEAGHISPKTGQGPWPEGLTAFALFMKQI
ncbi:RBBP9/YdeN family alpha/beta hydrolase [Hirschia baltica]|uniref:Alpha/beta hydrolase n=1 Tax=Hirschia baltica (strain ATCC 49814 / DSM 5838 / IFAM 1418) TaxID=582402 RepID=C6XRE3_HIRBI|nr:alpha/beta hydrolase [Hirschia baltica]ACT58775.1 protein of unknown function DUF1234 [Hirschia baltica ATCC 49814]